MNIEDWPADEILRIARTSGKSLEVRCAEAFLAQNWTARLGSYFADGALDVPRELDVLAERGARLHTAPDVTAKIRAVISCRGFPNERSPLTYSVSNASVPSFTPRLVVEHRGPWPLNDVGTNWGPLRSYEAVSAGHLLNGAKLANARHIVAFDQIERTEGTKKVKSGPQKVTVNFTRMKEGDSGLFKAIDSAVKAAQFWGREDYQTAGCFATITVPVLLLGASFWDVCIDGGRVTDPRFAPKAFMVNLFPTPGAPARELMSLIWSVDEIASLVYLLDQTFAWFTSEINKEYGTATARPGG